MINSEILLGLPDYQITGIEWKQGGVRLSARYSGPIACPGCGGQRLRSKGRYERQVRLAVPGLRAALPPAPGRHQPQSSGVHGPGLWVSGLGAGLTWQPRVRKPYREGGSAAGLTVDVDIASHEFTQPLADGESQSGSFVR